MVVVCLHSVGPEMVKNEIILCSCAWLMVRIGSVSSYWFMR